MIGSSEVKDNLQYAYAIKSLLLELYEVIKVIDNSNSRNIPLTDILEELQVTDSKYKDIKNLQLDTLLLLVYDCGTWFLKKGWNS